MFITAFTSARHPFLFLGAFAKLRKAIISFMFVCPLSAGNKAAPTGRILMKLDI
jgi:hypothetical protein